jgi:hypothetical protein
MVVKMLEPAPPMSPMHGVFVDLCFHVEGLKVLDDA